MFRVIPVVVCLLLPGHDLLGEVAWVPTLEQAKRIARQQGKLIVEVQRALDRGENLLEKGQAAEALAYADQAVDLAPDSPEAHLLLARAHSELREESGQDSKESVHFWAAVRHLLLARRLAPDDPACWLAGKQLLGVRTVQVEPRQPKNVKMYRKAGNFFAAGQYNEAARLYIKIMKEEPDFSRAYLHLGNCYFESDDPDQALKAYRYAAQLAPLDASIHRRAAAALTRLGRPEEARQSLMDSLLADPGYPLVWRDLARTTSRGFERHIQLVPVDLMLAGNQHYDDLLDDLPHPTRPAWQAYLDMKLRWQERLFSQESPGEPYRYTSREEQVCLTALAKKWGEMRLADADLEDPELDFLRQVYLDEHLDTFIFLELFSELLRPEFEAWKKRNTSKVEIYLNDYVYGSALASLRQGYNSSAIRVYNVGVALQASAPERAIVQYRRALAYEPYQESALDNLSLLYLKREEYERAEELLVRWLEKTGDSARALDRLSLIHFNTGRLESAVQLAEKALQHTDEPQDRERLQKNLEIFRSRIPSNGDSLNR